METISEKAINDFKALVLRKRGLDLNDEEAKKMALEWLQFFKLVYKPMEDK